MGRLFWKFFAFSWLAQVAGIIAVGSLFWLNDRRSEAAFNDIAAGPMVDIQVGAAAEVLRYAGRPVSKADLSEHALGRPIARHDRSVDVHVSSVRRKLGSLADGRSRIQAVHRQGYQLLKE